MIKINTFWRSIRMSWLRRLSSSKSTWAILHLTETKPFTYNPVSSNLENLTKARNLTRNTVWKDIYDSLITCRKNVLFRHPSEYLSIPINGEPLITENKTSINQLWCKRMMIKDILSYQGDLKKLKITTRCKYLLSLNSQLFIMP